MKDIIFCAGLPRSGSTLLLALLNQNADIHTTTTSPLLGMLRTLQEAWRNSTEVKAMSPDIAVNTKLCAMAGLVQGFYPCAHAATTVVDKNRGWFDSIELIEAVLDRPVKILAPVRPVLDILSSFEKLHRKRRIAGDLVPQEQQKGVAFKSVSNRCNVMLSETEVLGYPILTMIDAFNRGLGDRIHFVEFDDLCERPNDTLDAIYDFLGLDSFQHEFDRIEQPFQENDEVYGWGDLHTVRPKLEKPVSDWKQTLAPFLSPDELQRYTSKNFFWRDLRVAKKAPAPKIILPSVADTLARTRHA